MALRRCTYSAVSSAAAGIEGRIYPGSLAREMLKKIIGTRTQINRKLVRPSSTSASAVIDSGFVDCEFARQRFHPFVPASINAGTANKVQGIVASKKTGM